MHAMLRASDRHRPAPGPLRKLAGQAVPSPRLRPPRGAGHRARLHARGRRRSGRQPRRLSPARVPVPLLLRLRPDLGQVQRGDDHGGGGDQVRHRVRLRPGASVDGVRRVQVALGTEDARLPRGSVGAAAPRHARDVRPVPLGARRRAPAAGEQATATPLRLRPRSRRAAACERVRWAPRPSRCA